MKLTESNMLSRLQVGFPLLSPLEIRHCTLEGRDSGVDARIELALPNDDATFRFAVESKSSATPQSIQLAVAQARAAARHDEYPMIQIPFLSAQRLEELERQMVSGVDLCGNGVIVIPGRLWIVRSGQPNQYRDSRPLHNPYAGRSAQVARMLLGRRRWESLTSLKTAIQSKGASLSLPQASKAVRALEEDLLVTKNGGAIILEEPLRLLDKLSEEWKKPSVGSRQGLRLAPGTDWAQALSVDDRLRWAVTGESSASRYITFWQGGPLVVAVSNLSQAMANLRGTPEPVRNFADIELLETDEPGYFFETDVDERGVRWASQLQTWIELQAGDARQQDAAKDLRAQLLKELET